MSENKITKLETQMENVEKSLKSIENKIDKICDSYVTHKEFLPYKLVISGMVGSILMYALTKLLDLI